ncbi:hypothetical protein K4K53_000663 [Colletotrichum sp. SAR 10_77]|nr:hypothetical protein K4K52_000208 [Colletotrichum sp. SAR 10_76]KAI8248668.1 hypothetical protein K4K53_000663 [Colletotrichum sp. SAR 10_77]
MRRDLLEMFLDDAGGFEKCLGLQYASHDAEIEDSIRNPDPLLDRMGPITDRLFGLSLADDYDYGDYNHNFDGVAPDPTTAGKNRPRDIESMFTDGLAQELEGEKRQKVMQVVETLVIKVLRQPLVAKDTKSGEALVETPEDARSCNEQQTAESNAKSFPSDFTPPTQAVRPVAAPEVGVDSHDHRSQSISDGALIDTPEDEGNAWLPTDFYDFDFGDESNLQRWPGGNSAFVEGYGYEWAAVGATAFRVPYWNQTLDYTPAQGDGNLS